MIEDTPFTVDLFVILVAIFLGLIFCRTVIQREDGELILQYVAGFAFLVGLLRAMEYI